MQAQKREIKCHYEMRREIIEDQPVQVTVKSVRLNCCGVLTLTKAVRKPFLRGGRVIIV